MSISPLDQNILWVKAGGRCSMPDCRKKLVLEGSQKVPSQNVVIGENCHIIAKKKKEARGDSILSPAERDRYPNLILLCRNHHKLIDKDPSTWPIEKLHQIKSDHELWVETKFADSTENISNQIYSDLINSATEGLLLAYWDWFSDHAVRFLLSEEFVDGSNNFWMKVQKTVWPKEIPELEEAIINLCERVYSYVQTFMKKARLRPGKTDEDTGFWVEDKWWKAQWREDYHDYVDESKKWEKTCTSLFFNIVVALNEYAEVVRQNFKPNYLVYQGKFIVNDAMGVMSEMEPAIYIPERYVETE